METVIKTGRQIVQKQQTEQPKELDDRVTALKLLYNQLGAQVGVLKLTARTWSPPLTVSPAGHREQAGTGEEPQAVQEASQGVDCAD